MSLNVLAITYHCSHSAFALWTLVVLVSLCFEYNKMSSPMGRNDSWPAMAAVRHLECSKKAFHTFGDPILYLLTEFKKMS